MKNLKYTFMKRTTLLISVVLAALLITYQVTKKSNIHITGESRNSHMKLIIASQDYNSKKFDLTKEGSDFGVNQIVLHALIGTLVKYGPSGKIGPYLASSWEISEDKKTWKFKIRDNMFADDGSPLTAERFHTILHENLKSYIKRSKVMVFDGLVGWNNFYTQAADTIEGFTYDSQHVQFLFDKKPDDFFELLQMPYFGFWIED